MISNTFSTPYEPSYDAYGVDNTGGADTGQSNGFGPSDIMPYFAALMSGLQAKDVGGQMKSEFAKGYGVDESTLPTEPGFLSKKQQGAHASGIQLSKAIPYVGQYVAGALKGLDTVEGQNQATRYFAKMFNSVPDFRAAGLQVPESAPNTEEKVRAGLLAGENEIHGPLKPVVDVVRKYTMGSLDPAKFLSDKEKEHQKEIEKINQRNKSKYEDYRASKVALPSQNDAFALAYMNDPRMQYLLQILRARRTQSPALQKVS